MWPDLHPAAGHTHLPAFIADPGETDVWMTVMAIFLVVAVLAVGILFLRLHTLPERMAHKTHKLQFEIVAVLGLIALFTHMHIFWVAGLLLALIDLPDFTTPLRSMAGSLETMAGRGPDAGGRRDESPETEPQPGSGKDHAEVIVDRKGGVEEFPEPPAVAGQRRARPVLASTRDKELTDA
jgi:hypothetical protein